MQVLVLRLQCQDSIEEKIWQISEDKRMIADKSIVGGLFDRKTDEAARLAKDFASIPFIFLALKSQIAVEYRNKLRRFPEAKPNVL